MTVEKPKIRHRGIFIEKQGQGDGTHRFICHTGISKFLPSLYDTQAEAIAAVDAKLAAQMSTIHNCPFCRRGGVSVAPVMGYVMHQGASKAACWVECVCTARGPADINGLTGTAIMYWNAASQPRGPPDQGSDPPEHGRHLQTGLWGRNHPHRLYLQAVRRRL